MSVWGEAAGPDYTFVTPNLWKHSDFLTLPQSARLFFTPRMFYYCCEPTTIHACMFLFGVWSSGIRGEAVAASFWLLSPHPFLLQVHFNIWASVFPRAVRVIPSELHSTPQLNSWIRSSLLNSHEVRCQTCQRSTIYLQSLPFIQRIAALHPPNLREDERRPAFRFTALLITWNLQ